jgi:signal transduction histidine kinase
MTVRSRLIVCLALLLVCTAIVGGTALLGVFRLRDRYAAAEEQYAELRSLYEIGHRVATVRLLLNQPAPDAEAVSENLFAAAREGEGQGLGHEIRESLDRIRGGETADATLRGDVSRWLGAVASSASSRERDIIENRAAAMRGLRSLERRLAWLLGGTLLAATGIGVTLYRSIMRPVKSLVRAVSRIAGERLETRLNPCGDREFQELILRVNGMAAALERMRATMRQQVEVKSRQLVRSEQLAGVGYLAAGLAHEINNPLGIIAGFAQTTIRKLDAAAESGDSGDAARKARGTLEVICEEAFRCRDIAARLLDLARPGETEAADVDLGAIARRAVELVGVLPIAAGRELRLVSRDEAVVRGSGAEMLQVAVNLLTNALEACDPAGIVVVTVQRGRGTAMLTVSDTGSGMDEQTLAHAFDPFFTGKPRRGLSGCGLGLSVSHAIVERHGGKMYAFSEGPGLGSTLTVELPEADFAGARDVAA